MNKWIWHMLYWVFFPFPLSLAYFWLTSLAAIELIPGLSGPMGWKDRKDRNVPIRKMEAGILFCRFVLHSCLVQWCYPQSAFRVSPVTARKMSQKWTPNRQGTPSVTLFSKHGSIATWDFTVKYVSLPLRVLWSSTCARRLWVVAQDALDVTGSSIFWDWKSGKFSVEYCWIAIS